MNDANGGLILLVFLAGLAFSIMAFLTPFFVWGIYNQIKAIRDLIEIKLKPDDKPKLIGT